MPRQQREKSNSGYYHVMMRGNDRKSLFLDDDDKLRFIEILYHKKQNNTFFLHAFCLMDNHVHLMLHEGTKNIGNVIKQINISYVHYFNKKHNKVGHLFQDRFKSEVIEDDRYLLSLIRYIHQNPVKAGITKSVAEYKWSSYFGYMEENHYLHKIMDTEKILGIFSEDLMIAKMSFAEYINQDVAETFIDVSEEIEKINEEDAKKIFADMLCIVDDRKNPITASVIKEFKEKTHFPIRKIAMITGLNKDKINKMLRG